MWLIAFVCFINLLFTGYAVNDAIPAFPYSQLDFQDLVDEMHSLDTERPAYCDVHLDYQIFYDGTNLPTRKLFTYVNPQVLQQPVYQHLLNLRQHFNPQVGVVDAQSQAKTNAIDDFFNYVWQTPVFQTLVGYLQSNLHDWTTAQSTANVPLKSAIRSLWFDPFPRITGRQTLDSCGFEHVFLGEKNMKNHNPEAIGLHNWVVMHNMQETPADAFHYRGYHNKSYDVIAETSLSWNNFIKTHNSYLVNSSPTFDFALFTACALIHDNKNKCKVNIDGCDIELLFASRVVKGKQNRRDAFINTIFPKIDDTEDGWCRAKYEERQMCCQLTNLEGHMG
ncbi:Peptidase [Aphelenchoides besseyi]|nr:Peptidase [Aphelenchoides besseyi]